MRLVVVAAIAVFVGSAAFPADAQRQPQSRPGWPCVGRVDPSQVNVAEGSGGRVLLLNTEELADAAPVAVAAGQRDETVFRAGGELAEGDYEFDVPIDTTIDSADFFVSVQCLRSVTISNPSREPLRADADGVESHAFQAIRLFTVKAPAPGLWNVRFSGRGVFSVIVSARSELALGVELLDNGVRVYSDPSPGKPYRLQATVQGAASDLRFQLVNRSAGVLRSLDLTLVEENERWRTYAGDVTPPRTDFRVMVSGVDALGVPFQRFQSPLLFLAR